MSFCPNTYYSATGAVGLINSTFANYCTSRRKIRSGHELHQFLDSGRVAIINVVKEGVHYLLEIVRRNIACHAYCNSGGTIGQ